MYKNKAIFLDRDGTINVDKGYVYKIEDFEFLPGVQKAIKFLKDAGYLIVVVTNQSGVGRGYYSLEDVQLFHEHMQSQLKLYGTGIDAFYICPHHPEHGQGEYLKKCDCRKGEAGMLFLAAEELNIDLKQSFMVGDKLSDVEAGQRAGCQSILIQATDNNASKIDSDFANVRLCSDIVDAGEYILGSNDN